MLCLVRGARCCSFVHLSRGALSCGVFSRRPSQMIAQMCIGHACRLFRVVRAFVSLVWELTGSRRVAVNRYQPRKNKPQRMGPPTLSDHGWLFCCQVTIYVDPCLIHAPLRDLVCVCHFGAGCAGRCKRSRLEAQAACSASLG